MNILHKTRLLATMVGYSLLAAWSMPLLSAIQPSYETKEFAQPSIKWRPVPLWFWNNTTIQGTALKSQLRQMVEKDNYGGGAILPFGQGFRPEYLSEAYFELYRRALEQAQALGAQMSIYDEYGFPSGSMGAINGSGVTTFKNNHPEATVKRLDKTEYHVASNATFDRDLKLNGKLMALVGWNTRTKEVVPLREHFNAATGHLTWTPPTSTGWRVLQFESVVDGDPNVDYLSQEAVKLFVQDTHEQYYARFADYFGTTITSTFFDEPTMYRAQGRMWTDDFNEQYERRYGESPELLYPALWYDLGESTSWARNRLFSLHSTLYSEGFMKTISDWATAHGILATGHQDQEEISNPTSVAGDLMLVGKHMSMPGIDKIGGGRPTENFYKVVSSSANCWDKDYVMSETYGAMGNIPVEQLYQVAIEQYTKGVNHLIPHAVWYDDKNVTFLPELSWRNNLYNRELPAFNLFLARLNYLLQRPARHVADVAVLYPIQTMYAGHVLDGPKGYYEGGVEILGTDYPQVSRLLTDQLGLDFTYLHPEVIDDRCTVSGNRLVLTNAVNTEQFRLIILPGVACISTSNLKKIEQAWAAGIGVIFTTQKPTSCADSAGSNDAVQQVVARMLAGDEDHRPALFVASPSERSLQEAINKLLPQRDVLFTGSQHPFNYIHKQVEGHDVYFFGNIDNSTAENVVTLASAPNACSLLDPHTGRVTELSMASDGSFTLKLHPNQSVFLVDDALLTKNAEPDDLPETKPTYSIEVRVQIEQLSAGLCFARSDNSSYYMWQFNVSDPSHPRLRPHRWMGGQASVLAEINLPAAAAIQAGVPFNIRLEIDEESYVSTFINDVLVDERSGTFPYGRIGFRQSHDDAYGKSEIARYDDVCLRGADGGVLFEADFESKNPFTAGRLTEGWLRVAGQMSSDVYAWLSQTPPLDAVFSPPASARVRPLDTRGSVYNLLGQPANWHSGLRAGIYVSGGKKVITH